MIVEICPVNTLKILYTFCIFKIYLKCVNSYFLKMKIKRNQAEYIFWYDLILNLQTLNFTFSMGFFAMSLLCYLKMVDLRITNDVNLLVITLVCAYIDGKLLLEVNFMCYFSFFHFQNHINVVKWNQYESISHFSNVLFNFLNTFLLI